MCRRPHPRNERGARAGGGSPSEMGWRLHEKHLTKANEHKAQAVEMERIGAPQQQIEEALRLADAHMRFADRNLEVHLAKSAGGRDGGNATATAGWALGGDHDAHALARAAESNRPAMMRKAAMIRRRRAARHAFKEASLSTAGGAGHNLGP